MANARNWFDLVSVGSSCGLHDSARVAWQAGSAHCSARFHRSASSNICGTEVRVASENVASVEDGLWPALDMKVSASSLERRRQEASRARDRHRFAASDRVGGWRASER